MKKIWTMLLAAILIVPLVLQPATAQAAKAITINVDGVQLKLDQPPVMVQGRVMLPLRAIFEALDASVNWNPKTKTVTAIKADTTVVLKIKSKVATINNQTVSLDVPAQILGGRTMVPVRFVSEALGEDVDWNSSNQIVTITSDKSTIPVKPNKPETPSNISISPVSYVSVRDVGNQGDGRDLEVTYSKSSTESLVDHYRVLIVKASKSFNRALALNVSASNYTKVSPAGSDRSIILSQSSRDVDGDYIKNDQPYVAYVLAIGKGSYSSVLSNSSQKITLTDESVTAVTNVKISDISDFGDGRDVSVSFTRPQNDNNISNYRVFIVKTKDANNFSLATANNLSSSYYSTVNKSGSNGSTLTGALSSSSRDTAGESIKNGVPYTAFVLSVSSTNSADNKLSSASSSVTLSPNTSTPVITQVDDVNDYGDGRDLRVSFNKVADESNINSYRIFVVRASNYSNFTLTKANSLSSSYYTQVNKTGYNITQALASGARDTDGYAIQNGISYRVFVMAVATNSANNVLSSASNAITLYSNLQAVSNLNVADVNDYGDGRDLQVTFTKPSNESNVNHYRILVVPTASYSNFSLSDANNVASSNYTTVNKSGNNPYSQALSNNAQDVRGNKIKEGISYQVYVLTVANGNSPSTNVLSSASSVITLSKNKAVEAVSNVTASDVSDFGDGRDLKVSFTKPSNESNVNHYRILVVPTASYSNFNLSDANNVSSSNYTTVSKSGNNPYWQTLSDNARDVRGYKIQEGTSYQVYVLTVANGNPPSANALSSASSVTLNNNKVLEAVKNVTASDVSDYGDGRDLQVSFTKPSDESNIDSYRILVVPTINTNGFDVNAAKSNNNYTKVNKSQGQYSLNLNSGAKDTNGDPIANNKEYYVYVLSVGTGSSNGMYNLTFSSRPITLVDRSSAEAVENVNLSVTTPKTSYSDIQIRFKVKNEQNVTEYRVFMLPLNLANNFNVDDANGNSWNNSTVISKNGYDVSQVLKTPLDAYGDPINSATEYVAKVLTVATKGTNVLSGPSNRIKLDLNPNDITVNAVTNLTAEADSNGITVKFNKPDIETNISGYEVYVVESGVIFDLTNSAYSQTVKKGNSMEVIFNVATDKSYQIYVLSQNGINPSKPALSSPVTTSVFP